MSKDEYKMTAEFWRLSCGKLGQPPKFKAAHMFFDLVRLIGHPSEQMFVGNASGRFPHGSHPLQANGITLLEGLREF
ncbi:MAG: hypothetical protein COV46_09000 [Deltaproteobacteria bacterium CG11_big_fil_rev_8_21_14_0_20_49_13]|nr:MAG: hypothetical protein COV46_09000 [Deltaproteobacteria bacterium CG11_big_fil_rev_8_21_14_0_20_49_13]